MIRLVWLMVFFTITQVKAELVAYAHSDLPPLSYVDEGEAQDMVRGKHVDFVSQLLVRAGIETEFYGIPFARAYQSVLNQPNTLFFPANRTSERLSKFVWVGPIDSKMSINLYRLKSRTDLSGLDLPDILQRVTGAVRGYSSQRILEEQGFIDGLNMYSVTSQQQNVERFMAGRVDFIVGYENEHGQFIESHGLSAELVEKAFFLINTSELYMAFNKETDPELIQRIRAALKKEPST